MASMLGAIPHLSLAQAQFSIQTCALLLSTCRHPILHIPLFLGANRQRCCGNSLWVLVTEVCLSAGRGQSPQLVSLFMSVPL